MRRAGVLLLLVAGCEDPAGPPCESRDAAGRVTITCPVTWTDRSVSAAAVAIAGDAELVLVRTTLALEPPVEDADGITMTGNARLVARQSTLRSGSGKQWNLQAFDDSSIELEETDATEHSGLRAFGRTRFVAAGGEVEEVQLHDDVQMELRDGAAAYVVLFFVGGVEAQLVDGELGVGELTRTLTVQNGSGTATLALDAADVFGWQIDIEGTAHVTTAGAEDVVLAMHVTDAELDATGQLITSPTPADGDIAFGDPGPRFTFTDSRITSLNFYAEGASTLSFPSAVEVTEPNAGGTSAVSFGADVELWANLAQTYDAATMTLNGTRLLEDPEGGSFPSFTAQDESLIEIIDVDATPGARVYAVGGGRVIIRGGSGWTLDKLEEIDIEGEGGITVE